MKKNKKIIIGIIVLLLVVSIIIAIYFLSNNKEEIILEDDKSKWDREVYLPLKVKYDSNKRISNLYVKNNKVNFSEDYELFDNFLNVSENNIAVNASKNNNKTLYIINLKGKVVENITKILNDKTDKKYSGSYNLENDHLQIYYIDDNLCLESDATIEKYYFKTQNDVVEYVKIENINREVFLNQYQNYC